jgi:hypothetical protein
MRLPSTATAELQVPGHVPVATVGEETDIGGGSRPAGWFTVGGLQWVVKQWMVCA